MPTRYKRKQTTKPRKRWREEHLVAAIQAINSGEIGINEASRTFGVPSRTIRRRRTTGITKDLPLGPEGCLGSANEKRLVKHIQKLEKCGFAPDREAIRCLAYQFAEKLKIKHRFNHETNMAGYDWLNSFLLRNQEISIRMAQGLSIARGDGMNREEVHAFFDLLSGVYTEYQMYDKAGNVFNMDETGFQINNEPGAVIASKGAKDVHVLSSCERGENVTIISCCSAEGNFLPPVVIFKGVREKQEFRDGLPPGSKVFMNKKSSYISSELFLKWLQEHFVPKKPPGPTILILDGHASHRNSFDMLDFAEKNEVILICLPSHTTQALQPLDRAFFAPLKHFLRKEARQWMVTNPGRRITRLQVGKIIGAAWGKAASVETGVSAFRATGIFPLNPDAIPEHFFAISDSMLPCAANEITSAGKNKSPLKKVSEGPTLLPSTSSSGQKSVSSEETPSKVLNDLSPVPVLLKINKKRKKQSAEVLTKQKAKSKKVNDEDYSSSDDEVLAVYLPKKTVVSKPTEHEPSTSNAFVVKNVENNNFSSQKDPDLPVNDNCSNNSVEKKNKTYDEDDVSCVECWEDYYVTKTKVDWIQCLGCKNWLHESCTMYTNKCNSCGRNEVRDANVKRTKKRLHP